MIILESKGLKINNETVDFTITQPTSPITKNTKTGDTLDLAKNPNAIIECELNNALIVTDTYACEFETDDNQYNFNAKVNNQVHTANDAYKVTLQVVGKVVVGGKSTAPTISYDNTTFTVSASGQGEVKMYVDGVATVSPHTFDAIGTYLVTATAEQDGKAISDTVTENITIAKTAAPTISYDNSTFTVSASGQGTVKMYVDGVETVSPHTFTQGQSDVTYVVTATAIETGKFLSDTATENCLVPAASQPEPEQAYFSLNAGSIIESSNENIICGYDNDGSMFYAGNGDKDISVSDDDDKIVWAKNSGSRNCPFLMSFVAPEYITKIEILDFECASGGSVYSNNATYDSETQVLTIKDSAINAIKYELYNYAGGVAGYMNGHTTSDTDQYDRIQIWTGGSSGTQSISFSEIRIYYDTSHSWDSWNIPELVTMYDNGYFYWTGTTCSIVDENENNVTNTIVTGTPESVTFQKDGHTYSGMKASVDTTQTGNYDGFALYYPFYSQGDYYDLAVGYGDSFTI